MGSLSATPRILLVLVGAIAAGYALMCAASVAGEYWRQQRVAHTWCSHARACSRVELDSDISHPRLRVYFKQGRSFSREKLESELAGAGLRQRDPHAAVIPNDVEIVPEVEQ